MLSCLLQTCLIFSCVSCGLCTIVFFLLTHFLSPVKPQTNFYSVCITKTKTLLLLFPFSHSHNFISKTKSFPLSLRLWPFPLFCLCLSLLLRLHRISQTPPQTPPFMLSHRLCVTFSASLPYVSLFLYIFVSQSSPSVPLSTSDSLALYFNLRLSVFPLSFSVSMAKSFFSSVLFILFYRSLPRLLSS